MFSHQWAWKKLFRAGRREERRMAKVNDGPHTSSVATGYELVSIWTVQQLHTIITVEPKNNDHDLRFVFILVD